MALRVRCACEFEDGRGGDGDGHAVRDDGVVDVVTCVLVAWVLPADGVRHAVAEVHACVAEAHTRERCGEEHLALGLVVFRVVHRAGEVFDRVAQGLEGEDVGYGVCALVGGALERVLGTRAALVVGDCGPGFERVAEHVQAGGGVDGAGHGARVEGVDYAEGGFEVAVRDACLCALGDEVEDGGACCLGAGSCGCGDSDEGEEFGGDGEAFAERGVDEIEEVGVWGGLACRSAC